MPKLLEALGMNLKRLRQARDMSQEETARALGVSRQTIANYESGRGGISLETVAKLAAYFGVEETDMVAVSATPPSALAAIERRLAALEAKTLDSGPSRLAQDLAELARSVGIESPEQAERVVDEAAEALGLKDASHKTRNKKSG